MFRVEMLPAQQGDALWIEYGEPESVHRVIIDAGTPPTYQLLKRRIEDLPEDDRTFELFIVTHIDTDHIPTSSLGVEATQRGGERYGYKVRYPDDGQAGLAIDLTLPSVANTPGRQDKKGRPA